MGRSRQGFTLIEVVVSLVLLGILTAVAGMGIVSGVRAYLSVEENTEIAQKAQFALIRMSRELMELTAVSAAEASRVVFTNPSGTFTLGFHDGAVRLAQGSVTLDTASPVLTDGVAGLVLTYGTVDGDGNQGAWTQGNSIEDLIYMDLRLDMARSGSAAIRFPTRVHMRNTRNYGGAPPPTSTPTVSYCFITSLGQQKMDGWALFIPAAVGASVWGWLGLLLIRRSRNG